MSKPSEITSGVEGGNVEAEDVKVSKKKLTLERKVVSGVKVDTGVRAGLIPIAKNWGHWA